MDANVEFNIGDRYFAVWPNGQGELFTLFGLAESSSEVTFTIRWMKYDNYRHLRVGDDAKHDGIIRLRTLLGGQLANAKLYKIRDDKHLLQLQLKYA